MEGQPEQAAFTGERTDFGVDVHERSRDASVERVHDLDDATLFVDIQPIDGSWGRFGSNGVIQAVGNANRFKFLGRSKAGAGGQNEQGAKHG